MSAYRFPLATVLRLRRDEEERARLALAQTNLALRVAVLRRDQLRERYDALQFPLGELDPADLAAEHQQGAFALQTLEAARTEVASRLTAATIAQVTWHKAAKAVEGLERLESSRREEFALEEARREASIVDDIVGAAHVRRLMSAPPP